MTTHSLTLLPNLPIFAALSETERTQLLALAQARPLQQGNYAFQQGDEPRHFFILLQGLLKVERHLPNGMQLLVRFVLPGDIMGIAPLLQRPSYPAGAICVIESQLLAWPIQQWQNIMQAYPSLLASAQCTMAARLNEADERLLEAHGLRVEQRLARSLLRLMQQIGQAHAAGTSLSIPVTRQDLSGLANTTLYTASRVISSWDQKGLIEAGRKQITIPDLEAFARHLLTD